MTNKVVKSVVYGIGGFIETEPNNNIVEVIYYTKEELAQVQAEEARKTARAAILDRLGLTADEAAILLG